MLTATVPAVDSMYLSLFEDKWRKTCYLLQKGFTAIIEK